MKKLKKSLKGEYTLFVATVCPCGCRPADEHIDNKIYILYQAT
ncbi:hypothetical protein PV797_03440 [Clostridiaceae bacterium M8S5]|nr:hypothetical protein PV797_03440 [Clostridiaceae bacterium M8S5]